MSRSSPNLFGQFSQATKPRPRELADFISRLTSFFLDVSSAGPMFTYHIIRSSASVLHRAFNV